MNAVAVLPDGRVASGGIDARVLVWDPADPGAGPAEVGRHHGGMNAVNAVAVLPDGRVASGGADGRVLVWDPADPGAGPAEVGRHDLGDDADDGLGGVNALAVLPDGRLASGGGDGRVLVWDPADPGAGPAEVGRHDGRVSALAVLPDGRLASGGVDGRVLVWDPADPGAGPAEVGRQDGGVYALAVLPDGRLASGGVDGRVLVWDPGAAQPGPAAVGRHDLGYDINGVFSLAALPDGRVASGGGDGRVRVWDPADPGAGPSAVGRHDLGHDLGHQLAHDGGVDALAVLCWPPFLLSVKSAPRRRDGVRDRGSMGAVSSDRSRRRAGRAGVGVPAGPAGGRAVGDDAAVVLAGAAALVPVHLGCRCPVGSGDQSRGPRFLPAPPARRQARRPAEPAAPVPGKRPASVKYASSTVAHCETVCRGFYAYHVEAGTGPIVNPFPLARPGRVNAHHNPMNPFPRHKAGLFRPRVPRRIPRQIPDQVLAAVPFEREIGLWRHCR